MKARDLARKLGILPQSPTAPDGLTVHELVAQGRYPHQNWFQQWSAEDERIVQDALNTTNLSMFADRPVDTLSGGQRQRAWIAMALAQQTEVLLLDEPTTYLDLAYQMDVLDLLDDLNAEGRTIVMVLHDLNRRRYADATIAMRGGQIPAQAPGGRRRRRRLQVFGLRSEVILDPSSVCRCVPIGRRGQHKRRRQPVPRSNGRVHEPVGVLA